MTSPLANTTLRKSKSMAPELGGAGGGATATNNTINEDANPATGTAQASTTNSNPTDSTANTTTGRPGGYGAAGGYGGTTSSYGAGGYGGGYGGSSYGGGYGGSSYGGGYGSSYGGGYGSYGGGYGSYGGGYGSSYGGGYGRPGYNQYSNQYSKPMDPNQQQQPQDPNNPQQQGPPPPKLRDDVWGFLHGFTAMLNIIYSGAGLVVFGKYFIGQTYKIVKYCFGKTFALLYRITGLKFLSRLVSMLSKKVKGVSATDAAGWDAQFNQTDKTMLTKDINAGNTTSKSFFGKAAIILRILAVGGTLFSYFMKKRAEQRFRAEMERQMEEERKAREEHANGFVGMAETESKQEGGEEHMEQDANDIKRKMMVRFDIDHRIEMDKKAAGYKDVKSLFDKVKATEKDASEKNRIISNEEVVELEEETVEETDQKKEEKHQVINFGSGNALGLDFNTVWDKSSTKMTLPSKRSRTNSDADKLNNDAIRHEEFGKVQSGGNHQIILTDRNQSEKKAEPATPFELPSMLASSRSEKTKSAAPWKRAKKSKTVIVEPSVTTITEESPEKKDKVEITDETNNNMKSEGSSSN